MAERPNSEFTFTEDFEVTAEVKKAYDVNGIIILRNFLDKDEHAKLKKDLEDGDDLAQHTWARDDGDGGKLDMALWSHAGSDITGVITRSEKLVVTMEKLMEGEVYHYHSKMIMKKPNTGGCFLWHQDYGYWYYSGVLFPNMATAWFAVDRADQSNGCVEFLLGSHLMGRIDHASATNQKGRTMQADPQRVAQAKKVCPHMYGELDPGDVAIFHCNLLHWSAANKSARRRWGFLVTYNRADNNPFHETHSATYTPLTKVPTSAIKECDAGSKEEGKDYMKPHGFVYPDIK